MRRTILMLVTMALTLLVASGVALAVTRIGTDGPDTLKGTNGDDNLVGLGGNDRIFGDLRGNDNLVGGSGKDLLIGGTADYRRGGGDRTVVGGPGNDLLAGGRGSDSVVGNAGNDYLSDGPSSDSSVDAISGADGTDVATPLNQPASKDVVSCGAGKDWVLADRKDVVAPDCEKVFVGEGSQDAFFESTPESFWEALPHFNFGGG
jgi:Ca2+-binding RTX toxin-like protein